MVVLLVARTDALLRSGKMLSLTCSVFIVGADDHGFACVGHTNNNKRHTLFEASVINDPMVGKLYRPLMRTVPAQYGAYKFFHQGLALLNVQDMKLQPYSFRRGGATALIDNSDG